MFKKVMFYRPTQPPRTGFKNPFLYQGLILIFLGFFALLAPRLIAGLVAFFLFFAGIGSIFIAGKAKQLQRFTRFRKDYWEPL